VGKNGDLIQFTFEGESNKNWFLYFNEGWKLMTAINKTPTTKVEIQDEDAWKIFTNGIKKEEAIKKSSIKGNRELGVKIFDMLAVMA